MGETVSFTSNGDTADGYLALPAAGAGPGVMVVQEWWGLVPQIKDVCDRFADEGFVALAPDLYHGDIAEHTEMDKAAQLMTTLPTDRAARDMGGAVDFLLALDAVTGRQDRRRRLLHGRHARACGSRRCRATRSARSRPYYGAPLGDGAPDWSGLTAVVRGHFAGNDDFFPADAIRALEKRAEGDGQGRGVRDPSRDRPRVHERRERVRHLRRRRSRPSSGPRPSRSCTHNSASRLGRSSDPQGRGRPRASPCAGRAGAAPRGARG